MKITLVHGQNHKGSSYTIGRMLAEKFDGADIEEFFLPRDLEHFCLGCYSCIEDESRCPFYAEKKKILDSVTGADLLIFTTPTYCMHASAGMKSFLDLAFTYWMVHRPRREMFSKKAVIISTASGAGTGSAIKDIKDSLFWWGVPYIRKMGYAVHAMNWETVAPAQKEKIGKDVDRMAKKISGSNVHVGIKTKACFSAMRLMQSKDMGSSPKEKEYWQENGWLGKGRPWK
ncbi:MAG: NAD(P)H-dependent oxidoreductase [Clostridiales bacterium]|nr:NAD(P)H-dependent oxidoreductase [Clostridiales bacterium]